MLEQMTKERAYAILGVGPGSKLSEVSLAFRTLRDKYHPDLHPGHGKEYAEALAAFELLQMEL
ncbi:MAG TPA: DnaJ domain-containing protein [Methanocorpusculum sp.]|nr:DnaJ domain-containing protein [Methanocorpusculum sp.]HJJ39769.1 DnaJ domain-containing protein [Methanocorpusculum sp.]HJJ49378.1 DnaJ domain-containing protein [Methanocorpusculum sp.]HJJ56578.1 DnaJ domain-containing protein [Methanocorpusculum sp.]HJJ95710.1 DnaJ domain-containing protein [Methanocorpusculum sp.]